MYEKIADLIEKKETLENTNFFITYKTWTKNI